MLLRSQNRLRKELWFLNAGILSEYAYKKALDYISTVQMTDHQYNAVVFLAIDYLVQYFELASVNFSKLLNNCIKRQLEFVEKLVALNGNDCRYISSRYWDAIFTICDRFENTSDYVEKQFCIDALERVCSFLTSRSRFWVVNVEPLSYLKMFGRKWKNAVVYSSFLIPNISEYKNPLTYPEQKNFDKIENECFCKIHLSVDYSTCSSGEQYIMLEVLFDYHKGKFLGFLDNLSYIIKIISPSKYFMKSLRTVVRTDSMSFIILSDLPLKELRLIEKNARMGELISPFLSSSVLSKKVFRLIIAEVRVVIQKELERSLEENEDLEFWNYNLSESDIKKYKEIVFSFLCDYQCWISILKQWDIYTENVDRMPKRHFSLVSSVGSSKTKVSEDVINKSNNNAITELSRIAEKSKGNTRKPISVKRDTSKLSLKINSMDSTINSPFINEELIKYFNMLYDRKYRLRDEPNNCLNHTLRVILRCDTDLENSDQEIRKLNFPTYTIHDVLKQQYNFNLKTIDFFSPEDRKKSFMKRLSSQRRKERSEMDENKQYLENRRIISDVIDNALDSHHSLELPIQLEAKSVESMTLSNEKLELDENTWFGDLKETKEHLSAEFTRDITSAFGTINSDILQMFNEKRIKQLSIWNEKIIEFKERYKNSLPYRCKPLCCDATEAYKSQINPEQFEMIYSSVNANVYVTMKLLSGQDPNFDKEFVKILKGEGMQLKLLNEVNDIHGSLPAFVSLMDPRQQIYRKELSHTLCVLSFDIFLICASLSSAMSIVFDQHRKELKSALVASNEEIQDLFKLFEFDNKLDEAKSLFKLRLPNRTKEEIIILLKLSQDLRRFNEFIFRSPCCRWRQQKCIHILYASMNIDGNKKCQEPFQRVGGDRRLKKIEKRGNCMITMRIKIHPTTGVQIPFVEIFYDFFKGNHFCTMDMLRMVLVGNRGSASRIVNERHLLCLPYGELWIVQDLEWLKTRGSFMLAQDIPI